MLNLNLRERFLVGPATTVGADPSIWNRDWAGYDPHASDAVNFEQNRGVYNIGPRGHRERIATMSVGHQIRIVAEIDAIEDIPLHKGGVKQAVAGRILAPGNPDYDRLINTTIEPFRNPVRYIVDDVADSICLCGCETELPPGRRWVPGHDQRALHDRVTRGWRSVENFIRWYDTESGRPAVGA
ncbi:hypothetical protein ACWDTI_22045 [Gordonia sp. NPDC003424]